MGDDLEAIGHLFFWMLRGRLPWSGSKARTDEEFCRKIGEMKKSYPVSKLCEGHPQEFGSYLQYCRSLRWDERPDYDRLQHLMATVRARIGPLQDHELQWMDVEVNLGALTPITPRQCHSQPDDLVNLSTSMGFKRFWMLPLGACRRRYRPGVEDVEKPAVAI